MIKNMTTPRLYLFVGYPGAGKTTVSQALAAQTGAVHLWADKERRNMFGTPTHSQEESKRLYTHLNDVADRLLAEGKSVIFDTNFNFYRDREHLRQIAAKHGADTAVVWITTPKEVAKQRAVHDRVLRNAYEYVLPEQEFERMSNHLEPPRKSEKILTIDGTNFDPADLPRILEAYDEQTHS